MLDIGTVVRCSCALRKQTHTDAGDQDKRCGKSRRQWACERIEHAFPHRRLSGVHRPKTVEIGVKIHCNNTEQRNGSSNVQTFDPR
jgi:hypothetical protein